MNEEENQAFKVLHFYNLEDYGTEELKKYIKIIVNLVDKQQKEIEDLRIIEKLYNYRIEEIEPEIFISKDKLKEKIKEIESLPLLDFAEKEKFNFEYSIDGLYCMKKGVIFILKELLGE